MTRVRAEAHSESLIGASAELAAIERVHKAISRVTKHDAEGWLTINHLRAQRAWDEMRKLVREEPELVEHMRRDG